MKKLKIVKGIVTLVATAGVGIIVGNAIKATTPRDIKNVTKFCIFVGGLALSGIAGDKAGKYVEAQIDDLVSTFCEAEEIEDEKPEEGSEEL